VAGLALAVGSRVVPADPSAHDAAVARISHLPHLLALALAQVGQAGGSLALSLAASSFADGTRVAGTRPELVRAMCETNREELIGALDDAPRPARRRPRIAGVHRLAGEDRRGRPPGAPGLRPPRRRTAADDAARGRPHRATAGRGRRRRARLGSAAGFDGSGRSEAWYPTSSDRCRPGTQGAGGCPTGPRPGVGAVIDRAPTFDPRIGVLEGARQPRVAREQCHVAESWSATCSFRGFLGARLSVGVGARSLRFCRRVMVAGQSR